MPKTRRLLSNIRQSPFPVAQARQSGSTEPQPGHRNTGNWSSADDEVLVAARAAGLNWQSTAARHFPNKTANACRKRHERLVERRNHEDWTPKRLDTLAVEYMELRKEIWAPLAVKIGERWNVVEAKCMEKGLRNLQSIARMARKTSAPSEDIPAPNKEEHEGDSGIGCSDAELEPVDVPTAAGPSTRISTPVHVPQPVFGLTLNQQKALQHILPRPPPLPLYQPPPTAPARAMPNAGSAGTSTMEQTRGHFGHSHHGHHHHHDTTYLTSTDKNDAGVRITRVGLFVNLGMAIAKGIGGYVFNSKALSADAIHSLTDLISDFTTLATVSYSLRSPTTRFPTGYGKIESLGALGVSGILLSGGIMIGLQAVMALTQQFFPDIAHILSHIGIFGHGHSHSHSHGVEGMGVNINAAWLAAGSIIIKEWLYRATMKIATEKRSSVLASNAYHHRVDSLTAVVALATITASHFLTNATWLDPVGGLIISGMIVQAGYGNTKAALLELADVSIEDDMKHNIESAASQALGDLKLPTESAPQVQGIKSGQNYLIEVAVTVPSTWTLEQMTEAENGIREKVSSAAQGIKRVSIRFTSSDNTADAFANEFVASNDQKHAHEHEHEHEHSHDDGHSHSHESAQEASKAGLNKRK
ncbi:hypothetical protein KCU92_g2472, partial [Aureobasidium melanogenum]